MESLYLSDDISDAGLAHVAKVRTLSLLSLGKGITNAGLPNVKALPRLTYLDCNCPQVTDAGLRN